MGSLRRSPPFNRTVNVFYLKHGRKDQRSRRARRKHSLGPGFFVFFGVSEGEHGMIGACPRKAAPFQCSKANGPSPRLGSSAKRITRGNASSPRPIFCEGGPSPRLGSSAKRITRGNASSPRPIFCEGGLGTAAFSFLFVAFVSPFVLFVTRFFLHCCTQ